MTRLPLMVHRICPGEEMAADSILEGTGMSPLKKPAHQELKNSLFIFGALELVENDHEFIGLFYGQLSYFVDRVFHGCLSSGRQ